MQTPAHMMESKSNMILKAIRNFNAGILKFIMSTKLRAVGATILGACAGLSLTSNVIPSALSLTGNMDSFSARWGLGGFAVYSMMSWAVGGWAVQRTGDKKLGAIVLGSVGLATGLLFTGIGIGTEMNILLTGGGAALLYGAVGGMIVGDALRDPPRDNSDSEYEPGTIGNMAIFSFFKKQP